MTKFCGDCGTVLQGGVAFCTACGGRLQILWSTETETPQPANRTIDVNKIKQSIIKFCKRFFAIAIL